MHYLDNAATTPVNEEVIQTITEALQTHFANPSSLYLPGYESERVIEKSRVKIAAALGCGRTEVYFTASGSEGNNMAILGALQARKKWGKHVVTSAYEHPCVEKPLLRLAIEGELQLTTVSPNEKGDIEIEEVVAAVRDDTALVTIMHVNNETGAIVDVEKLAEKVKQKNPRTAVHVDGVQGFTKVPLVLSHTQIDSYAVSGHKLNAPKGIGALYLRKGYTLEPLMLGGGQENKMRPGTENIPYIVGFAKAVEIATSRYEEAQQTIAQLNAQLEQGMKNIVGTVRNSPQDNYKGIMNYSVLGLKSETMLHFLEEKQVYISSGSACGKGERSHTLTAMNLPEERMDSSIRVSFNGENTPQDIEALLEALQQATQTLAKSK